MKKVVTMGALAVLSLMAGCGNGTGNEYVGKWVRVDSETSTLQIERNGNAFILRNTEPSFLTGKIETANIPATLKDGSLQVQVGGFGAETFLVDKASGYLTNGRAEYKRVN